MNKVYMLMLTVHMDERRTEADETQKNTYRTQPEFNRGLNSGLAEMQPFPALPRFVLRARNFRHYLTFVATRASHHTSEPHPAMYFVTVRARDAYDAMEEATMSQKYVPSVFLLTGGGSGSARNSGFFEK